MEKQVKRMREAQKERGNKRSKHICNILKSSLVNYKFFVKEKRKHEKGKLLKI